MTTPTPEYAQLEDLVRAEADAKIAAVKPLADAYKKLQADRDEFTTRDAANVAAVRRARTAALKAGFTDRALNEAGYKEIAELVKPATARKTAARKSSAPAAPRKARKQAAAPARPKTTNVPTGAAQPEQRASAQRAVATRYTACARDGSARRSDGPVVEAHSARFTGHEGMCVRADRCRELP